MGLVSLDNRLSEVHLILEEAEAKFEKNELLYKALCRSAQVLLSAHLEGYLKDLVKNAIEDINHYSSFKDSNLFLKKRLCEYFIMHSNIDKKSKEAHQKTLELISVFDNLDTKFKREYFYYTENKNPKASVLDKIAEQFGVEGFFKQLKKSNLDLIFSNTSTENIETCQHIKSYLLETTDKFPYTTTLSFLEIDDSKPGNDNLWDALLSDLLKRRHDIAHGTETDTSASHVTIGHDKTKVQILMYAFTAFICTQTNPVATITNGDSSSS